MGWKGVIGEHVVTAEVAWQAAHDSVVACRVLAGELLKAGVAGGEEVVPLFSLSEGYSWQVQMLESIKAGRWSAAAQAAEARDAAFEAAGFKRPLGVG